MRVFFVILLASLVSCKSLDFNKLDNYELHDMREYRLGELDFEINIVKLEYADDSVSINLRLNERLTGDGLTEAYVMSFKGEQTDSVFSDVVNPNNAFTFKLAYTDGDTLAIGSRSFVTRYFKLPPTSKWGNVPE